MLRHLLCLALLSLGPTGCRSLPRNPERVASRSLAPAPAGLLRETRERVLANQDPDASAFLLLAENADALLWRLALIEQATRSIDLQYFIWEEDAAGRLMLEAIFDAVRRGVRVRILVDDFPSSWSDAGTALVSRAPDIYIRKFNPQRARSGKMRPALEWLFRLRDLNPRMHNKLMVVDGHWAVVGGRNIGNPYFGLSAKYNFRDLDALVTGPIVTELGHAFDHFWNSDVAFPGEAMAGSIRERERQRLETRHREALAADRALLAQTPFLDRRYGAEAFRALPGRMATGPAVYLQDEPIVRGDRGERLSQQLARLTDIGAGETVIVTPYLIPPANLVRAIAGTTGRGGSVTILTASLGANNHTAANSHYKKYRRALLRAGAALYEFRHNPAGATRNQTDTPPVTADFVSLHIKAIVQDKRYVYLGSLNIDPRALVLNTENMMGIDSPALAAALMEDVQALLGPENSWQVVTNQRGAVRWRAGEARARRQPARSGTQRVADFLFRWLPIEGQL